MELKGRGARIYLLFTPAPVPLASKHGHGQGHAGWGSTVGFFGSGESLPLIQSHPVLAAAAAVLGTVLTAFHHGLATILLGALALAAAGGAFHGAFGRAGRAPFPRARPLLRSA